MKLEYIATSNILLKDFMLEKGLSRAFCRRIKLYGKMYVNGTAVKNYYLLQEGDSVVLEYDEKGNDNIFASSQKLDIVYEDEYLLVINKPHNLASQPSHKHYEDNLVSQVKAYFIEKNIDSNVHLVNRLDMATSGLVIIAKSGFIHSELAKQEIEKNYYALVKGKLEQGSKEELTFPIERDQQSIIKRKVSDKGKPCLTIYKVISSYDDRSLVDIELKTGRTHQIRVHFSYINHPLIGDNLYNEDDCSKRLYLHCYHMRFLHPVTKKEVDLVNLPNWNLDEKY